MRWLLAVALFTASSLGSATWTSGAPRAAGDADADAGLLREMFWSLGAEARFEAALRNAAAGERDRLLDASRKRTERLRARSIGASCGRGGCGGGRRGFAEEESDCEETPSTTRTIQERDGHSSCCGYRLGGYGRPSGSNSGRPPTPRPAPAPAGLAPTAMWVTPDSASVSGIVSDAAGDGVAALDLELLRDGESVAVTVTDEVGAFAFGGLEAGTYLVSVAGGAVDAMTAETAVTAAAAATAGPATVELGVGQALDGVVLVLDAGSPALAFADDSR